MNRFTPCCRILHGASGDGRVFDAEPTTTTTTTTPCDLRWCFFLFVTWAQILLDKVEASTVFVKRFQARLWELTDRALRRRADKLIATLRHHGEAVYDRYYYLATYTK